MSEFSPEVITAKPISGLKEQKITVTSDTPLQSSGVEPDKRQLVGSMGSHEVRMIERAYNVDDYISKWQVFKDAGLPVVPTLRKTDRDTIVMTDLKADGSQMYGKNLYTSLRDAPAKEQFVHPLDPAFRDIMSHHMNEVTDNAYDYALQAARHGIRLPNDDAFELVLHPDRNWELMMIDLRQSDILSFKSPDSLVNVSDENYKMTDYFLGELRAINRMLKPKRSWSFGRLFPPHPQEE